MTEAFERIPMLDLTPEIDVMWDDLMKAVQDVLRSGQFILGPQVEAFEEEVAAYLGVKHAIGVNSGTDAIMIALRALGVGPGDEVITTPFTFFATPEAISNVGATPAFIDIDPVTFNLDPACIEPAITERTKAIVPVHLYGQACDMDQIIGVARRHDLKVVEDVAQAMGGSYKGRRLGGFGNAAALSFFPSKNLPAFGDGGMIVTSDDEVAEQARMLRAHGSKRKYANEMLGYNSRLDEIQAAVLRIKLSHLDQSNQARRLTATTYSQLMEPITRVEPPFESTDSTHVFNQYTVRVHDGYRDCVQQKLADTGISTAVYYPVPCSHLPVYSGQSHSVPCALAAAGEVLSLPIGPSLSASAVTRIVSALVRATRELT